MITPSRRSFGAACCALLLTLLGACASDSATKPAAVGPPDCTSRAIQRTLTYCVSPGAARYAVASQDVRALEQSGQINPKVFPLPVSTSPVDGPDTAAVTLVVFSDLECPACAQAHPQIEALRAAYPDDVRVVFKHLPLSFHKNAKPAARAAMAAHAQGKFWPFVSAAYAAESLNPARYLAIARSLKLDEQRFLKDMQDASVTRQLSEDAGLVKALNVNATPTIFLNGVPLPGGLDAQELAPVIAQQKALAKAFVDAGVPQQELYWRLVRAQYQPLPEPEPPAPPEAVATYVPVYTSPAKGALADDALVTVVAFSDFQCPYCAEANKPLEEALKAYPKRVRLVFKHFPLPFHEQADEAAAVAVVAHQQGKFWAMHDLLFAGQDALDNASIASYAAKAGVKIKDVPTARQDKKVVMAISDDVKLAITAKVNGTPTFFVNGTKLVGGLEVDQWKALFEDEIKRAQAVRAAGALKAEALYEAVVRAKIEAGE